MIDELAHKNVTPVMMSSQEAAGWAFCASCPLVQW